MLLAWFYPGPSHQEAVSPAVVEDDKVFTSTPAQEPPGMKRHAICNGVAAQGCAPFI